MVDEFLLDHFDLFLSAGRDGRISRVTLEAGPQGERYSFGLPVKNILNVGMPGIAGAPAGEGSHHDSVG